MVCLNPLLAAERAHKRQDLLSATERLLAPVAAATQREKRPLRGQQFIALRVVWALDKHKMAQNFHLHISDYTFHYTRNPESIARETTLHGLYIVRTSLP